MLLCPTHHRQVDRAPRDYPVRDLRTWKAAHERRVALALQHVNAPPAVWHVPIPRRRGFTGRDAALAKLEHRFAFDDRVQVIQGPPGIGKSQLTVHYTHQTAFGHELVWWLSAERPETLSDQFVRLAAALQLPVSARADTATVTATVQGWLRQNDGWLLIFDAAQDPVDLHSLLPDTPFGQVLITSINPNWEDLGEVTELPRLSRAAAKRVLVAGNRRAESTVAAKLAAALHDFPLALQQARSYAAATRTTLGHYLDLLEHQPELTLSRGPAPIDYRKTVAATFAIAVEQVRDEPSAVALIELCAMLAADDLPIDLLRDSALDGTLGPPLDLLPRQPHTLDDVLSVAYRFGLLAEHAGHVTMHQLLQLVVRDLDSNPRGTAALAVRVLNRLLPDDVYADANWDRCSRLTPHILTVCAQPVLGNTELAARGRLLDRTATWLELRGQYGTAVDLFRQAVRLRISVHGTNDSRTLASENNLGGALTHVDPAEALAVLVSVRERCDALLTVSPDTVVLETRADCLTSLSWAAQLVGDDFAAVNHADDALRDYDATIPTTRQADAKGVIDAWTNRGNALLNLRRYAQAKTSYQRALELARRGRWAGTIHESMIHNNLGVLAVAESRPENALEYHRTALGIRRQWLGEHHPLTAVSRLNRAAALRELGQLRDDPAPIEEALQEHQAVLGDHRQVYGEEHWEVAQALNNIGLDHRSLARVLKKLGDRSAAEEHFSKAEKLLREAYEHRRVLLREGHPLMAQSLENIGATVRDAGRPLEAIPLFHEALAVRRAAGQSDSSLSGTFDHLALAAELAGSHDIACGYAHEALRAVVGNDEQILAGFAPLADRMRALLRRLDCA